jgi:hypothetical protein
MNDRRCKPGIRAKYICGMNKGKVVLVVRRYFGEEVADAMWPRALFPLVMTSLGAPLRAFDLDTGSEAPASMAAVAEDADLKPLQDDDGLVANAACELPVSGAPAGLDALRNRVKADGQIHWDVSRFWGRVSVALWR